MDSEQQPCLVALRLEVDLPSSVRIKNVNSRVEGSGRGFGAGEFFGVSG